MFCLHVCALLSPPRHTLLEGSPSVSSLRIPRPAGDISHRLHSLRPISASLYTSSTSTSLRKYAAPNKSLRKPIRTIALYCWILGVSNRAFAVKIKENKTVYELKEVVFKKSSNTLTGIDVIQLVLCKVSIAINEKLKDEVTKREYADVDELLESHTLSNVFPPPEPAQDMLHIVVKVPPAHSLLHNRKRNHEGSDRPQVGLLKREFGKSAPSSLAHPEVFSKISGPGHAVARNRPFELNTIPLVLLHEAFAIFKDRCQVEPSEKALVCLMELAPVACKWHDTELMRRAEIRDVLRNHMDIPLSEQKVPGTEYVTDGNLSTIVMPAAIRECKNEQGHILNEVISYYGRFLISAFEKPLRFNSYDTRFPSVLIVDMGSHLGFYGALWDGNRVRVEPLTPIFDLSTHWREKRAIYAIASALDALMAAVDNIEAHYKSIQAEAKANPIPVESDSIPQKARGFPFMTSYEDDGQRVTFTYNEQLNDEKLIFSAILHHHPNFEECLVKYTWRYSEAAHNYLASHGSAPRIRRCVRISADWTAVIMDKSTYQVLYGLRLSDVEQEKVRRKVRSVVQTLHQGGFVHGDIRDTNILIDLGSLASEDVVIHLIDFDWAGRVGEAKYPIGVNRTTMRRPVDVEGGGLIKEEHDLEMVSYLFT